MLAALVMACGTPTRADDCPMRIIDFRVAAIGAPQKYVKYLVIFRVDKPGVYGVRLFVTGTPEDKTHDVVARMQFTEDGPPFASLLFAWPAERLTSIIIGRVTNTATDAELPCGGNEITVHQADRSTLESFDDSTMTFGNELQATAGPLPQYRAAPDYPVAAKNAGVEGTVIIEVMLRADGSVLSADVHQSSGSPLLDWAAQRAARRSTFDPGKGLGPYLVEYDFKLR